MARIYIGMGSNINPAENFRRALQLLSCQLHLTALSTVYLTAAIGKEDQPPFYNAVCSAETETSPRDVKQKILRSIEDQLLRQRTDDKYASRTIDLDLLLYGDLSVTMDGLVLPDPDILRRPFLAIPLFELAPALQLPPDGQSIRDVAAVLSSDGMEPLLDYTRQLREALGL